MSNFAGLSTAKIISLVDWVFWSPSTTVANFTYMFQETVFIEIICQKS